MRLGNGLTLCLATFIAAAVTVNGNKSQVAPLQGAWRLIRTSLTTGEQPNFQSYTQAGLVLFTARHYSLMYVEGNEARRMFRDPARPTDVEKLEAFDSFVGHSGSYSLEDSIVAMHIAIAKSPNLMAPELRTTFARFAYRITGDTLRLTRRTPRGVFAMQLVRAD